MKKLKKNDWPVNLASFSSIRSKYAFVLFIILVIIVVVRLNTPNLARRSEIKSEISSVPTPTPNFNRENYLLLGYGGGGHQGGKLTDTILFVSIFKNQKKILLTSIPRDLYIKIPMGSESIDSKINASYAIGEDDKNFPKKDDAFKGDLGGIKMVEFVVGKLLNAQISGTLVANFSEFVGLFDLIGSLEVQVPYDFTDEFYPVEGLENESCDKSEVEIESLSATMSGYLLEQQFKCRFETIAFSKGKRSMNGDLILKFVRSRHSSGGGGDFGRSARQVAVLKAVQNAMLSPKNLAKIPSISAQILKGLNTNITISQLVKLLTRHPDLNNYEIESITLSTKNILKESRSRDRQYILVPKNGDNDAESIQKYLKEEEELRGLVN